ncbi:MAG TPA: hypothetical protein VFF11_05795 [Candidatus Binatia bacterium]|nr:hypothetical protein [Candidatus Binatia bacterium]
MANDNHVGARTARHWQYYRLGLASSVPLGVSGNAIATIAIMDGGVTANIGGNYIVRRITVRNSSGSVAAANLTISGPLSGQITNAQGMAVVSAANMYQDFSLVTSYTTPSNASVSVSVPATTTMLQDQFFYVNVQGAAAANNTVDVAIFGELVDP